MAKIKRPAPVRPTVAKGVPAPVAWSGPSRSLSTMASQIGRDRALSEFYKSIVQEQWDYDDDYRDDFYTERRDNRRHDQAIDLQDHREYLKSGSTGLGNASDSSKTLKEVAKTDDTATAAASKLTGGMGTFDMMAAMLGSNKDEPVDTKVKAAAEKKAEQDEAEAGWWHSLKDNVVDVADSVTPEFVEDAGSGIAKGAKWAANTAVGQAAGDAGAWAFDKLSRPSHAIAGGLDALVSQQSVEDTTNSDIWGPLNDVDWEGFKDIGSGISKGWMGEEHKTFSTVMRNSAARDLDHDWRDSLTAQVGLGLAGDLIVDPLNLIGVGIVKNVASAPVKGAQAIQQAQQATKVRGLAEEIAEVGVNKIGPAKQGEDFTYSVNELVGMLSGKYQKKSDRIADIQRISGNVDMISQQLSRKANRSAPTTNKKLESIRKQAETLQSKIKTTANGHGSAVAIEELVSKITKQEKNGTLPVGSTEKFYTELDTAKVQTAFKKTWRKGMSKDQKLKAFNAALGDDWIKNPALTDTDRASLFDDMYKNAAKNPEFKDVMGRNQRALTAQTEARKHLTLMEKAGNKQDIAEAKAAKVAAETHVKEMRGELNRAQIQSFQQRAMAKSLENLGHTLYKDPERAKNLQAIMDTIESKLGEVGTSPLKSRLLYDPETKSSTRVSGKREIEHDIDPERATPNTGATGSRQVAEKDEAGSLMVNEDQQFFDPDLDNIDSVLAASPDSFNYESQLQAAYTKADIELQDLKTDYAPFSKEAIEIPEALRNDAGMLDSAKFFSHLKKSDGDWLRYEAEPSGNPQIDQWMQTATQRFNSILKDEHRKMRGNKLRRKQEETLKQATAEVTMDDITRLADNDDVGAKKLLSMFGAPPKGVKTQRADANLYPHVTIDGKKVFENGAENLAGRVDGELSQDYSKWIKSPDSMNEADTEHLASLLKSIGLSVGDKPESVYRYVLGHKETLLDAVSPAKLAFAQEFKKQHGMTLQEAKDLRAGYTGKSVGMADEDMTRTKWQERHPYGVTEATFTREVMSANTIDELLNVLDGNPVSVTIPPRAKDFGKSPAFRKLSYAKGENAGWKKMFADADSKDNTPEQNKAATERLHKALTESGMPKTSTLDEVRDVWAEDLLKWLEDQPPAKLRESLQKNWKFQFDRTKSHNEGRITAKARASVGELTAKDNADLRDAAFNKAKGKFVEGLDSGNLLAQNSDRMLIPYNTETVAQTVKRVADVKKAKMDEEVKVLREELATAKQMDDTGEAASITAQIEKLRKEWDAEKADFDKAVKTARESAKVIEKRLREEVLLNIASTAIAQQSRSLKLNVAGNALNVPGTRQMFAAAEKAGSLPVINKFAQVWSDSFASQRKQLPDDMQVIANRALSNPAEVISYHVRDIKHTLGQVPMKVRETAMRGYLMGSGAGSDNAKTMIDEHFTKLLPYFQGQVDVANGKLTVRDINSFLPDKFKYKGKDLNGHEFKTGKDVADFLQKNLGGPMAKAGDPIEMVWATRIATEQALAKKTMVHAVNETFGVKRGYNVNFKTGAVYGKQPTHAAGDAVEKLQTLGWQTNPDLGHGYYFPPESQGDIARLMAMFEPKTYMKVGGMEPGKFIDEVTGMWKTMVTIYNVPGYYTRNAVGETMSAWLGGVNNPKVYRKANDVLRFLKGEGDKVDALRDHMPALAHALKGETNSELGRKIAVTRKDGTQLSAERVAVLYKDQGLSSGFINTEYRHHYSKTKERFQGKAGFKQAGNANDELRRRNESFEDFFRMGHFIDKMNKAPVGMSEKAASEWAASEVRKYHFDYTDFTKAEKAVMLRVFPFYKWTRKALPLMASMMFVKPGKMMAYPKIMNSVSEGLVGTEDLDPEDDQGYMPNYQNIAPGWVQDLWAYQVGGPTDAGSSETTNYLRVQTPQMDALNMLSDPTDGAYGLLNPLLKLPFEQLEGETKGNMNLPIETTEDRVAHIARTIPQGGALANTFQTNDDGESLMSRDNLVRLLTGMGYYDVESGSRFVP